MRFCKYIKLSIILFILGYIGMMSRLTIYGEENIQLELVSDKSEIQSGEEVQVQLNLIRGEYLAGMSVWVGYDDNVLEVVSAETSKEVLFPATVNPNGKKDGKSFVGYSYASADGTTESGTILTIKFKVLENITQDETEIRAIRSDAATSKSNKGKSNTNDKSSQSVSKTKDKKTNDKNNSDNKNEKSDKTDNNSNNTNEKTKSDSNSNTETDNKQNNTTKIDIDKENSETGTVKGEKKEISERTDDSETQTNHIDTKNIEKKINNKKENKTAIWKILGILIAVIVIAGSVALLIYKKREDK